MDLKLRNRKVLITGASRGIGNAIATLMVDEGADVAFCARSEEGVARAQESLSRDGNTVYGEALDVRDEAAFGRWVENAASISVASTSSSAMSLRVTT